MMRPWLIVATGSILLLASLGRATAQAPSAPCETRDCVARKWEALHKSAADELARDDESTRRKPSAELKAADAEGREAATRQASIIAAVDAVEADDSTAAATVRRLAGAIKTNPEGTEAGLVIAPFALAGYDPLSGFEVTFAALKDDFTRAGASYTFDGTPTLDEVWADPATCPVKPRIEKLDNPKNFYVSACTGVVAALPDTITGADETARTEYQTRVHRARIACGLIEPGPGDSRVESLPDALNHVRHAVEVTNEVAPRVGAEIPQPVAVTALGLAGKANEFKNWTLDLWSECYSDKDIRGHINRLYWDHRTWKFAVGANVDFFPRKWGFNPAASEPPKESDPDLPNGDVKTGEARFDFSTAKKGLEFSAGLGFGRGREELGDELRGYWAPSASIARAFSLLPKKAPLRTTDANGVRTLKPTEDGELPPRLVLGVSAAVQYLARKRDFQETRWNAVTIQPHADFLINGTLSFRLGIPFKGEIVVRKKKDAVAETPTTPAQPEVPEKRDLQWTLPVAIVAVLKL